MIELNSKKFAETEDEMLDSLFNPGGTCVGYAKRNKRSITLMDIQKNKIGVINRFGCLCCATKRDNGYWYSFATIDIIGRYDSYRKEQEDIASLAVHATYDTGEKVYVFKQ